MGFTNFKSKNVLRALRALKFLNTSLFYRKRHKRINEQVWEHYFDNNGDIAPFINEQSSKEMRSMRLGRCSADFNACETIAVYNVETALEIIGKDAGTTQADSSKCTSGSASLPEVIFTFERKGLILDGFFGVEPTAIYKHFQKSAIYEAYMITREQYNPGELDKAPKSTAYILTAFNDENTIMQGIHTVAIVPTADYRYMVLNSGCIPTGQSFATCAQAISAYMSHGGKMICIICVWKK